MSAMPALPLHLELLPMPEVEQPGTAKIAFLQPRVSAPNPQAVVQEDNDSYAARFGRSFPERRRHLQELWQALQRNATDRAARGRLARHLHTLAGAAEAYGFQTLGHCSADAVRLLGQQPAPGIDVLRPTMEQVFERLDARAVVEGNASRAAGAPSVWLDPPDAPQLSWLRELLSVSGYRVHGSPGADAVPQSDCSCHLLVTLVDKDAEGLPRIARQAVALTATKRPFQIIALSDRDDYESRNIMARSGAGLVLPTGVDAAHLLRAVEAEIASMSGAMPTAVVLSAAGRTQPVWTEGLLAAGIRVRVVASADELWRITHALEADAVLLDTGVTIADALALARVVRQDEQNILLPFLALGFHGEHALPPALLECGVEPVSGRCSSDELAVIVHDRVMRRRRRILGSRRDSLTGVLTRVAFAHALRDTLEGISPWVAFAVLDLDNFKMINDTQGHLAGDRVLRETAGAIRAALPPGGLVGRYGGDEFVVALNARSEGDARRQLAQLALQVGGASVRGMVAKFSVGAILLDRNDRVERMGLEQLTERADELLLASKSAGKGRVTIALWKTGIALESTH